MKFSIIIPTRNRSKQLNNTLLCILQLDYNIKSFEILVVDNNSPDSTKQVINSFAKKHPKLSVTYLFEKKLGPSYARNKAIKNSRYPHLLFLDDDVIFKKDLLKNYKAAFKKNKRAAVIGGKNIPISRDSKKLKRYMTLFKKNTWIFSDTRNIGLKKGGVRHPNTLITANMCMNTAITGKIYFDEDLGRVYDNQLVFAEDTELCIRLLNKGLSIYYDPEITTKHIINKEKLHLGYIFGRFYRAGIDQKILDTKLHYMGDTPFYNVSYRFLLKLFKQTILNFNLNRFMVLIKEVLFVAGYKSRLATSISEGLIKKA